MASDLLSLKKRNDAAMANILRSLSAQEQVVFQRVVQFEMENRHILRPDYMRPIRQIIEQSVRPQEAGER